MDLVIGHAFDVRGLRRVVARISADNVASQRVATSVGLVLTDEPIVVRERKGRRLELLTWSRGRSSLIDRDGASGEEKQAPPP